MHTPPLPRKRLSGAAPRALAAGLSIAATPATTTAAASDYPVRPIRFVVGVPPGGPTDIFARMVGQKLAESWGQSVIVDNRPGAGQTIGADIVARSTPNGYTLFMCTQTFAVNPAIFPKLPYDSEKDFAPVTLVATTPLVLFVHPGLPVKTLKELLAHARARPAPLNFGSSGPSSSLRLSGELLKLLARIDLVHVPYKGTAPALTDLAAGQVHIVFSGLPAAQPFYATGRIRPIAVASERRTAGMPDLPTTAEAGLPGLLAESWFGVLAPGRTPAAIVERLNAEIVRIVRSPELKARLVTEGADAGGNSPAEFAALIRAETARWGRVVRENQIRIE
jgi:tripartite-type tricarboxylate transporter receptor subunit TctC